MRIAIVGAGPSGLAAAAACLQAGHTPTLLEAKADPSPPDGATAGVYYLHDPLGMLDTPSVRLTVSGDSDRYHRQDYARKLYGREDIRVSYPGLPFEQEVWDGLAALSRIFYYVRGQIKPYKLRDVDGLWGLREDYDLVISTVPLPLIFPTRGYREKLVHIATKIHTEPPAEHPHVYYVASPETPCYRTALAFGRETREYISNPFRLGSRDSFRLTAGWTVRVVSKVEAWEGPSIADQLPEGVVCLGRYGAWDKRFLTHTVYHEALSLLRRGECSLGIGRAVTAPSSAAGDD